MDRREAGNEHPPKAPALVRGRPRPERIDQIIHSIVERDAVSYHTLEVQRLLRSLGFQSEIFSDIPSPGLASHVRPLATLAAYTSTSSWVCYQASIGSPGADVFAAHPGTKLLNYHNITPPELVSGWMPELEEETRVGRRQLAQLAPLVSLGIAVSDFNRAELDELGYELTTTASLMMERSNFDTPPDGPRQEQIMMSKSGGGCDWLFVGRMLPHKAQDDVIRAFAAYRETVDGDARLHLVGPPTCERYVLSLRELVDELGLEAAVEFAGSVTTPELVSFYKSCDVFVCCSRHEGFGAPLIEAMSHGLPVVAIRAAAVADTVGEAGILLDSPEPRAVAASVHDLLSSTTDRRDLVARGYARAASFDLERARAEFVAALQQLIDEPSRHAAVQPDRPTGTSDGSRPQRIDQVVPSMVDRDAIGFHTLEAQRVLRSMGFVSDIFAVDMAPAMAGRVRPIEELPRLPAGGQWICYQASIGSRAADVWAVHPARKIVDYHNVTPPELVETWMPQLGAQLRLGRHQLERLGPLVDFGLGDSEFNVRELRRWGEHESAVSRLMLDRANFDAPPDPATRAALAEDGESICRWLYVGHVLPHKAQHDVILGFAAYLKAYDPDARLHLVGRNACPPYRLGLEELVGRLGIGRAVTFESSVSAGKLSALYHACDVFVSCSEHEGFGAPLVEAMHHRLPVVCFRAGAVPETVGAGGILLDSKKPATVAAAVHLLVTDEGLRKRQVEQGLQRSFDFAPEIAREEFRKNIEAALGA